MKLAISEVFYSIQGEGITSGYPAVFVRLGGCNLMCGGMGTQFDKKLYNDATWRCDTIEVWMKSKSINANEVLTKEEHRAIINGANIIITGGEPLIQQKALKSFIEYVDDLYKNVYIEIETNGTVKPSDYLTKRVDQWNCSPKIENSGNEKVMFYHKDVIKKLNKLNTIFKFVVSKEKDWQNIESLYMPLINKDKVWLMPSGENKDLLNESKQIVAEICKRNYIKYTNRLHIEIWNKKTGV